MTAFDGKGSSLPLKLSLPRVYVSKGSASNFG